MSLIEVSPDEERPHEVGKELGWSEAYSFQFVDPADGLALLSRIGVRPTEGIMDVGLDLYVPDGGILAARHVRSQSENTFDLLVEGVSYEMVRPLQEWKISYDGPAHSLRSSREAANHEAWHRSALERLIVDLRFVAEAPAVATKDSPGRFGQPGRFVGEVWLSGDQYSIDVTGVREKAWGLNASVPRMRRRFWLRFDDGSAVVVDRRLEEETEVHCGWVFEGGMLRDLRKIRLVTTTEDDSYWQKSVELEIEDASGIVDRLTGEVTQVVPLPTVRGAVRVMVCSSVARFAWKGRAGVGIVEYLHCLDESGRPQLPLSDPD